MSAILSLMTEEDDGLNPFYIMEGILINSAALRPCAAACCLNPFYIMEGILMYLEDRQAIDPADGLNPFYIMEGILIREDVMYRVGDKFVLIHSTSWKEF